MGRVATPLIESNTTIPVAKSQVFSTAADNQTKVEIHIVQGERSMATDNKSLGRFILDGIPSAPRGVPQIEVTFDIDSNGILKVIAKDKATGKSQHITIKGSTGLSDKEIEKMTQEAKTHAEEDKKKKELVDSKNKADNLIFQLEKSLKELGDKVNGKDKEEAQKQAKELKELIAKEDISKEEIEKKTDQLMTITQKIGEVAHQQKQAKEEKKEKGKTEETKEKNDDGEVEEGEVVD